MIRGLALLAAGLGLASAQTYTVTETVDACPASYSNVPSTVTVQSSVTVTPTPLTDSNLNAGTPFVIQVAQYSAPGALTARAAPVYSWLTANGSLTKSNSSATQYHITGGRLFTSNGLCVSANTSTAQTTLAASPACGPFSGNFSFENDMLNWTNSAFFDGAAQFFGEYNATSNATQVMAMLNGLLSAEQLANRLVLYGRPAVVSTPATSTLGQSTSLSSYVQPSASASLVSTPNGICGGNSGYTCAGASFGTCCSAYGYCGSSADYCGTGCQTGFGACGVSGQSVSSSSTGAMSAPGAMSTMPIYANTSARASVSSMSTHLGPGPAYPDSSSMSSSVTSSLGLPAYTPQVSSSTTMSSSSLPNYFPAGSSSTSMSSASSSTTTTSPPAGYFSAPSSSYSSATSMMSSAVPIRSSSTSSSMSSTMPNAYTSSTTSSSTSMSSSMLDAYSSSMTSSSSMSMASTTTSHTTTSSTTTTSTTTTLSPSASASAPAYVPATSYVSTPASCPADNNTVTEDSNSIQYELMCGGDTMPGSYTSVTATNNFNDCFLACDADSQCMSWTYSGSLNGALGGTCYFKTAATTLMYIDDYHVAGNRLTPRAASPGSASSSASSSVVSSTTSSTTSSTSSSTTSLASTSMVAPSTSTSSTSSSMMAPSSSSAIMSSGTSSSATHSNSPLISIHIGPNTSAVSTSAASTTSQAPSTASDLGAGYTPTPTPCTNFGDPVGTDEDDAFCEIDLPFNISMYSGRGNTNQTFVSTNGLLTLYAGTDAYSSDGLPDNDQLGNYAIVPFWDDLYYYASEGDGEGIFYEINEAQTTVNYTFVLSRASSNFQLWEFGVFYDSTVPGVFTYVYNQIPDQGATATVGIQGLDANNIPIGTTYSNSQADIAPAPGLTVVCDSNSGVCTGSNGQTASQTYVPSS